MRYIVSINELKDVGEDIRLYSSNDLKNNINEFYNIKNKIKWESEAGDIFFNNFDDVINELYSIENRIEKYGQFFKLCSNKYFDSVSEMKKEWDALLSELDDKKVGDNYD